MDPQSADGHLVRVQPNSKVLAAVSFEHLDAAARQLLIDARLPNIEEVLNGKSVEVRHRAGQALATWYFKIGRSRSRRNSAAP